MIRVAWRSLISHKLRSGLTALAILLGVAMISGTFVLTDQIQRGFEQVFGDAYKGTDVTITRKASFTGDMVGATAGLPQSMVEEVRAVDGVAEALGYVGAQGAVAVDGKVVETGGAPTLFFGGEYSDLSATTYREGRPPQKSGEVGIISKLANDQKLAVGSPITVISDTGAQQATVSGIFTFGAESSLGGSLLLSTTLADAQKWFDLQGRISEIDVKATAGVPADTLADRVRAALPRDVEVKTGEQAAADQTKQVSDAIGGFLRPVLLIFGGVALLVGAFMIFNAFSMTVAQRRRELAMLRALGASRRQVLLSIAGEALAVGVLASVLGLFAGLGVAAAVNALFKAVGVDIPRSGPVLEARTIVLALVVGVVITLLSALVPAWNATRVPPVAALQEGATLPSWRFARFTPYFALGFGVLGALFILAGMYGPGAATQRIVTIVFGALVLFVAVAMVSRYLVRPIAGFLGWPLQKLSPVSGRLARDNSVRNPGRTALTAAALMIGLAVIVLVAVLAQGLKSSFIDSFDRTVKADYVIAGKNFLPIPADTALRVQSVPTIANAAELNLQQVQVNKKVAGLMGIDPYSFRRVWNFDWVGGGGDRLLGQLGMTNALIEQQTAAGLGVKKGQTISVLTVDGTRHEFKIIGEYYDPVMLNGIVVSTAAYNDIFPKPQVLMVLAKAAPGADKQRTLDAVKGALADVPTADPQTAQEYKDQTVSLVNQLLNLLYLLLAVSVVISLIGIINTLYLAVHERTREIGLVRAIGMSRRQVRATVRYESIITSVIGAVLGIVVGVALGYVVTVRLEDQGINFALPGLQLVVFVVVGVVVGVLAAILPARRAARIDILEAIHYE